MADFFFQGWKTSILTNIAAFLMHSILLWSMPIEFKLTVKQVWQSMPAFNLEVKTENSTHTKKKNEQGEMFFKYL